MSTDLINIIKKAAVEAVNASNPAAILFGKVIKTSPLEINVEQKMILTQEFLVLTKNVSNYETNVKIDINTSNTNLSINIENENIDLTHKHDIKETTRVTINNALKVNDNVILMRAQGGQKYIVLDKLN